MQRKLRGRGAGEKTTNSTYRTVSNNPNRDRPQRNPFPCSTRVIICTEFDRGNNMRTKISNRKSCTYRDIKKHLQIQIQEKYSKEKLFQVVELIV